MHRLGGGFADEIPERDIDGAHRPHRGAPRSDEHRIAVHIGPDRLAGHWVRPQNVVPKELSDKLGHETPGPVTGVAEAVSLEAIRCADTYQRVLALIHPSGCEGQRFAQGDGNRPRLHGRNLLSLFGPRGFYRCSRVPIHDMTLPEPASTSLPPPRHRDSRDRPASFQEARLLRRQYLGGAGPRSSQALCRT